MDGKEYFKERVNFSYKRIIHNFYLKDKMNLHGRGIYQHTPSFSNFLPLQCLFHYWWKTSSFKTIFATLNIFGILKTNFLFRARVVSVQSSQKIYHLKSRCFARCLHLAIISDLLFSELKWSWWSANIISVFSVRHRSHTFDSAVGLC